MKFILRETLYQQLLVINLFFVFKVYNDADILEKIMKDRRRDLGPATDDDDMMSPKLKISMSATLTSLD